MYNSVTTTEFSASPTEENILVFQNLGDAARNGFRTKGSWKNHGRQVLPAEDPVATAPHLFESDTFAGWRDCWLYSEEQTAPLQLTPRQRAIKEFAQIFAPNRKAWTEQYYCQKTDQVRWTHKSKDKGHGKLSQQRLVKHLNGRRTVGTFGCTHSRFAAIDLDFHGRDREIFLEQVRIISEAFQDQAHYQVAQDEIDGIHVFFVLPSDQKIQPLARWKKVLTQRLTRLDEENSDLLRRIEEFNEANPKNPIPIFQNLEIYPSKNHAFRLPLSHGRIMLLDRPLLPKKDGKHDVEGYLKWLRDPQKSFMAAEDVQSVVELRLASGGMNSQKPIFRKIESEKSPEAPKSPSNGKLLPRKGRWLRTLVEGFSGITVVPGSLSDLLLDGATACWMEGLSSDEAKSLLFEYAQALPEAVSAKIKDKNWKEVRRQIAVKVKETYSKHDDPKTDDDQRSVRKLTEVKSRFQAIGFRFSEKSTWKEALTKAEEGIRTVSFELFLDEEQQIEKYLSPILKLPFGGPTAIDVAKKIVEVVSMAERGRRGLSREYWKKVLEMKDNTKISRIMDCMKTLGFIEVLENARGKRGRGSRYGVGKRLRDRLKQQ